MAAIPRLCAKFSFKLISPSTPKAVCWHRSATRRCCVRPVLKSVFPVGYAARAAAGAYVALAIAIERLVAQRKLKKNPLYGQVAAVSVGIYQGVAVLDLDYAEDSEAETDMNIVMNDAGHFIEVQGTAEGHAFTDDEFNAMLGLARSGIADIIATQSEAIASART